MTKIKACPFCGASGEDATVYGDTVIPYYVECNKCYALGPNADTEAEAIQKWNAAADRIEELEAENERLLDLIHSPETENFVRGAVQEAAHQIERWGPDHDEAKGAFDWFWLIGYLSQKAAGAQLSGDLEKAKHHTITTAAALSHWHATLGEEEGTAQ